MPNTDSDSDSGRTPQQTAEMVRERMYANDRAVQGLGMDVVEVSPGHAAVTMTVQGHMLNGHATCHGGFLAALADTAFAYACNSYNELTVASGFSIDLVAPAREGDLLTARSVEMSKAGCTGVYDSEITNQRGERIAMFRGRSYTIKGKPAVAD